VCAWESSAVLSKAVCTAFLCLPTGLPYVRGIHLTMTRRCGLTFPRTAQSIVRLFRRAAVVAWVFGISSILSLFHPPLGCCRPGKPRLEGKDRARSRGLQHPLQHEQPQLHRQDRLGKTTQYTVTGLRTGQAYYFAVTAHDTSGNESGYSNEVCYTVSTGSGDTDGDGASDADERDIYGTDPRKADTDGYGLGDGDEVAFWRRPWHEDDDGDGVVNLLDEDADGDGLLDGYDSTPGSGIVLPSRKRSMPVGQPILHTMGFATRGIGCSRVGAPMAPQRPLQAPLMIPSFRRLHNSLYVPYPAVPRQGMLRTLSPVPTMVISQPSSPPLCGDTVHDKWGYQEGSGESRQVSLFMQAVSILYEPRGRRRPTR
jgi:hypothetical protein